jgi:hypothetical protein
MKKALALVLGTILASSAIAQQTSTPDGKPNGTKRQASSPQKPPAPAPKKPQPAKSDQKAAQVPTGVSSSTTNASTAAARKDEERTAESPQSTVGQVESLKKGSTKKSTKKPVETQKSDAKPQ